MHPWGRLPRGAFPCVLAAGTLLAGTASAAPALRLDPSFGDHGVASGPAAVTRGFARAGVVDGHGRTVVLVPRAAIRFRTDGSVDRSFGGSGRVALPAGQIQAAVTAGDGSLIVAVSAASGSTALCRLSPDGSVDTAFGRGGTASVAMTVADMALRSGVLHLGGALTTDPRLVTLVPAVARLAGATGAPLGPVRVLPAPPGTGAPAFVSRVAVGADGRMVILTRGVTASGGSRFAVMRIDGDGAPDASFGGSGVVSLPGGFGDLDALALTRRGGIVVAGRRGGRGGSRAALVRLLPSGARDRAFGRGGVAVSAAQGLALHVVPLPDGTLVTTGTRTALRFSVRGVPLGRAIDLSPHRGANFVAAAGAFRRRVNVVGTRYLALPGRLAPLLRVVVARVVPG